MSERVRTQTTSAVNGVRDVVSFAVSTGALALTKGAAGVPEALAKGWMAKSGVNAATNVLTRTLLR